MFPTGHFILLFFEVYKNTSAGHNLEKHEKYLRQVTAHMI